jgi:ribonucleoside-diphosphate reductase alpha chain
MAMMMTMSVYHPDILKFIQAKENEDDKKIENSNMSVVVDNRFMEAVEKDESYQTYFDFESGRIYYDTYKARDIFNLIIEGAWRNGEPGILFYDTINDSPYKYSGQEIMATNPCGEQPLPFNGACNLGSIDISKLLNKENIIDLAFFELIIRLSVRFLNDVVDKSFYPTEEIRQWVEDNKPIGLGIMGLADYYLRREIAYGSPQSLAELEFIMKFMYEISNDESIRIGEEKGVPKNCQVLPQPRRNITLISIAPTGTISLIAGCNSGIEPIFSEITIRNDKTGSYSFISDASATPYFRCAVSANGAIEVTWEEHVAIQAAAQRFCDSGVSKTINFPAGTHRETIYKAFMEAWKSGCKGITAYRNGSRKIEVLQPKNLKRDLCPVCESDIIKINGIKKCTRCEWKLEEK